MGHKRNITCEKLKRNLFSHCQYSTKTSWRKQNVWSLEGSWTQREYAEWKSASQARDGVERGLLSCGSAKIKHEEHTAFMGFSPQCWIFPSLLVAQSLSRQEFGIQIRRFCLNAMTLHLFMGSWQGQFLRICKLRSRTVACLEISVNLT